MDNNILVNEFEEQEYDLSSIGVDGFYLLIEENYSNIYSNSNFYVEIPDRTNLGRLVSKVDKFGNIIIQSQESTLILSKEQYDLILDILKNV